MIETRDAQALNDLFDIIDRDQLDDAGRTAHQAGTVADRRIQLHLVNFGPFDMNAEDKGAFCLSNLKSIAKAALDCGFTVDKNAGKDYFDLRLTRGAFTVIVTTPAEHTCSYEPVYGDDGVQVVETVETVEQVKVQRQVPKTVRRCVPLLSVADFETVDAR